MERSRREWATWMAAKGINVFIVDAGSKRPLAGKSWYVRQSTNAEQINEWFDYHEDCNYGLHLGSEYVVIDLDLKKGTSVNGIQEFETICAEHGIDDFQTELNTLMVKSPSDGYHLYFKSPFPCANRNTFPNGIDVRGQIGYVVGPGSYYDGEPDGKNYEGTYELINPDADIQPLPEFLHEYIVRPSEKDPQSGVPVVELDLPASKEAAYEWLRDAEPAIHGHNGDDRTYATIQNLRDFGLSEEGMFVALHESGWNERCEPPWEDGELDSIIQNAWLYGQNRPGIKSPEYQVQRLTQARPVGGYAALISDADIAERFHPTNYLALAFDNTKRIEWEEKQRAQLEYEKAEGIPSESDIHGEVTEETETPPTLDIMSFADLLAHEPQDVPELIPGWLEKGTVTFLSGHGGVGKSRLALQVGLCIQAGKPLFGLNPEPATFVYISAEDDQDEVTRRVHRIVERLGLPHNAMANSVYIDRSGQNSALAIMRENTEHELTAFHDELCKTLRNVPGHKFVVLDSAYDFVRFAGRAKIDEDCVNTFIKEFLGNLCRQTDSTLYVPWHPSYAGQERGDGSGWSVAWHNAPRARDSLTYDKKRDIYTLEAVKRNHTLRPEKLELRYSDGALIVPAEIEETERLEVFRTSCVKFAEQMAELGQPLTKQKNLTHPQTEEMGNRLGYTVDGKFVKEELERALMAGEIDYVPGSNTCNAGYYPKGKGETMARKSTTQRRKPKKAA